MLDLSQIQFPIFPLPSDVPINVEGSEVFVWGAVYDKLFIDDRSKPGQNLGLRRLQIQSDTFPFKKRLFTLSKPIFRYADIFDVKHTKFIDFSGKIFTYTKKHFFKLKYYDIQSYRATKYGYSLKVRGIHCRFPLNKPPGLYMNYAGIIHAGKALILYKLSAEKLEDTVRKI